MEDALAAGLIKQLQPAFYYLGAFCVVIFITFGGALFKLLLNTRKEKEQKLDVALDNLKKAIVDNTQAVYKLEVKVDLMFSKYASDLKNLGKKLRDMEN